MCITVKALLTLSDTSIHKKGNKICLILYFFKFKFIRSVWHRIQISIKFFLSQRPTIASPPTAAASPLHRAVSLLGLHRLTAFPVPTSRHLLPSPAATITMSGILDTQNKAWAEDKGKFGYRMLEKMGWSDGKGLGAREDGMTQHLRARKKRDAAGIGAVNAAREQWKVPSQLASGLDDVLARLVASGSSVMAGAGTGVIAAGGDGARSRGNGKGFFGRRTAGKNVGSYSKEALREIFGGAEVSNETQEVRARSGKNEENAVTSKETRRLTKNERRERRAAKGERREKKRIRRAKKAGNGIGKLPAGAAEEGRAIGKKKSKKR